MFKKQLIGILLVIVAIGVLLAVIWSLNGVFGWLQNQTEEIVLALIMAVIVGLLIETVYKKLSPQSKLLNTTQTHYTDNGNISSAQLHLPNNNNIVVDGAERIIGREDFLGVVSSDKLYYIGKDHFKITMDDGRFYIEDLKTKNGTSVNGDDLKGSEKRLLNDGDEILIAKSLSIKYNELAS